MVYIGTESIEYLTANLSADDKQTSSHWKQYHSEFKINRNGKIQGIQGFGGSAPIYRGLKKIVHYLFQRRYKKLGRQYKSFNDLDKLATKITKLQERAYDLDVLRQVLTLSMLNFIQPADKRECLIIIGDGFASLSTLAIASKAFKQVILINLTKTLLVDLVYFAKWAEVEEIPFSLITDQSGLEKELKKGTSLISIQASNYGLLQFVPANLAVNIASMQEMDNSTITEYFKILRKIANNKDISFYCCNREYKKLPDGTVTEFSKYPWSPKDTIVFDSLCPWHQEYYTVVPPSYKRYDGLIRHRFVKLSHRR